MSCQYVNPPDEPQFFHWPTWRDQAACRNNDPELFFPHGTTGQALDQIEQAKAVCRQCPVINACLEWALQTNEQHGVWGGRSEEERRGMARRRKSQ